MLRWLVLHVVAVFGNTVFTAESCCATCLAQPNVGSADALDFNACSTAQTTCCFDKTCQPSTFGTPTIDLTSITFSGKEMLIPSGNWIRMQWPAASEVKYLQLKTGQTKTTQVTNSSVSATIKSGYFFVCAALEGQVFLRGFADVGCTASKEFSITVTPGKDSSCSEALPAAPLSVGGCDPVRGAMKDGVCTCLEDFSGPPQCLSNSFWKRWGQIISYSAGGLSMITAMFGFYRFYKMRKEKEVSGDIPTPATDSQSPKGNGRVKLSTPVTDPPASPLSTYLQRHSTNPPVKVQLGTINRHDNNRNSSVIEDDIMLLENARYEARKESLADRTSNEFTL